MSYYRILYRVASLLAGCLLFAACTKDPLEEVGVETESPFKDGYSLNLMLTLDHMGGTRAAADTPDVLREFENFIDPGKCRVLFFDHEEKFLFESKSRWVKQLSPGSDGVRWMVSVPMYPYGNDAKENWEWEQIRQALQDDKFKIAILANRPTLEVYPDLETHEQDDRGDVKNFQNAGPYWTREDTRGYVERTGGDPNRIKTVFDLHHTQYDPIYRDKGFPTDGDFTWEYDVGLPNFYEFVMGKTDKNQLSMSSTSSWVDFGEAMDDEGEYEELKTSTSTSANGSKRRYARRADVSYPIPMYGIQEFNKIENWVEGVPFNLSDLTEGTEHEQGHYAYKDIALLRSVVKLEFVFPKYFPNGDEIEIDILQLAYPNVYARNEPMNVWKPTDQLWTEGHENEDCEWFTLKKYARLVESNNGNVLQQGSLEAESSQGAIKDPTPAQRLNNGYNLYAYRRRLSWFYGAWLEKDWPFTGVRQYNNGGGQPDATYVTTIVNERRKLGDEPPQIFNPCIQRNNRIMCFHRGTNHKHVRYDGFIDDRTHYHFVVYTGERNSIDPNYLYKIDNLGGFAPTICYWHIGIRHPGRTNTGSTEAPETQYYAYSFPITDYARTDNPARTVNRNFQQADDSKNNDNRYYTYKQGAEPKNSNAMIKYAQDMVSETDTDLLPWPLMRNHHYKIVIGSVTRAGEEGNDFGFSVRSEVNYSESLGSQRPIRTAAKKQQN